MPEMPITQEQANSYFEFLKRAVVQNPQCAANWHTCVRMAAEDEGVDRASANRTARRFTNAMFGVTTNDQ